MENVYLSVRNVCDQKNRAIEAYTNRYEAPASIELQSLAKIIATYDNSIFKQYFMFIGLYFYMSLHITEIKQAAGSSTSNGEKRKRISCEKSRNIIGNIGTNRPDTTAAIYSNKSSNARQQ